MKPQRIIPVVLIFLIGCVTVAPKITPEMSPVKYSKPENSNAMISCERVPYVLWYDDINWNIVDSNDTLYKEFQANSKQAGVVLTASLRHISGEVVFFISNESRLKSSYNNIINEIEKRASRHEYEITKCEYRDVNGNTILFFELLEKDDNSIEWVSANYCLVTDKGMVRVAAITQPHLFEEHQNHIFDLLNGLDFASENEDKKRVLTNSEKYLINRASAKSNLAIYINVAEALNSCNLSEERKQIWSESIKQDTRNLLNRLLLNYNDKGYGFHIVKNIEHSHYVINATFTRYCSNNLITDHTNLSVTSAHDGRTYATDTIKREKRFDRSLSKWVVTDSFLNGHPVEIDDTGLVFSK